MRISAFIAFLIICFSLDGFSSEVELNHSAMGELQTVSENAQQLVFSFSPKGTLKKEIDSLSEMPIILFTYDKHSHHLEIKDPDGKLIPKITRKVVSISKNVIQIETVSSHSLEGRIRYEKKSVVFENWKTSNIKNDSIKRVRLIQKVTDDEILFTDEHKQVIAYRNRKKFPFSFSSMVISDDRLSLLFWASVFVTQSVTLKKPPLFSREIKRRIDRGLSHGWWAMPVGGILLNKLISTKNSTPAVCSTREELKDHLTFSFIQGLRHLSDLGYHDFVWVDQEVISSRDPISISLELSAINKRGYRRSSIFYLSSIPLYQEQWVYSFSLYFPSFQKKWLLRLDSPMTEEELRRLSFEASRLARSRFSSLKKTTSTDVSQKP